MRLSTLLFAGACLLGGVATPVNAGEAAKLPGIQTAHADVISAAKRKTKKPSGASQSYGRSQTQIACTPAGCGPIPQGCRVRPGMNPFTWNPTGFDEIVCPYYR